MGSSQIRLYQSIPRSYTAHACAREAAGAIAPAPEPSGSTPFTILFPVFGVSAET
jgi:hypothetical protein